MCPTESDDPDEDTEPDEDADDTTGGLTAAKAWPFIPKYIG